MSNHYYAGNCVDLFDQDGLSVGMLPYEDATEFAQAAVNWAPVSQAEFCEQCSVSETLIPLLCGSGFLKDENHDVYIMYHLESDIHYFFVA